MTLKGCRAYCDAQNMGLFVSAVHYSNFNSILKYKNMTDLLYIYMYFFSFHSSLFDKLMYVFISS